MPSPNTDQDNKMSLNKLYFLLFDRRAMSSRLCVEHFFRKAPQVEIHVDYISLEQHRRLRYMYFS